MRVLTSGNHDVGHLETKPADTPEHIKYEQETTLAQARWLGLSSNAKQIFARHSSEYIQFDEPETVITAIREVYDDARKLMVGNRLMTLTPPFSACSRSQASSARSLASEEPDQTSTFCGVPLETASFLNLQERRRLRRA